MTNPKISIITPVRNAGKTVSTAILSVAHQLYPDIEHVLIDGLSDDDTVEVVRAFQKDFHHIVLVSEPDTGIYNAMNKGLDKCTGDWILFLGADDEFHDADVLKDLVGQGMLRSERVVYGDVIIRGDNSWAKDGTRYDGPFDLEKLFKRNICHQAVIYPRSVIGRVGYYNEHYEVTADWDYNLRCFAQYPFVYVNRVISFFRAGGRSSGRGDQAFYNELPYNVIRYFKLNPGEEKYHNFNSPFFYPVARYREEQSRQEAGLLRREHAAALEQLGASHQEELSALHQAYETRVEGLETAASELRQEVAVLHRKSVDLQNEMSRKELEFRDQAAMLNQQAEFLRQTVAARENQIREMARSHRESILELKKVIEARENHINAMYRSYTWRAGRILLSPVTVFMKKQG